MGLKEKMLKKAREINENRKDFEPLELTEGNVEAIFNRCVKKPDEDVETVTSAPFGHAGGYSSNNDVTFFAKDRLLKNKTNIFYMMGQVKDIAEKKEITLADLAISYPNLAWTKDLECLLKLVYLCCNEESLILYEFNNKQGENTSAIIQKIEPTLSPKDTKFPEWYKGYKARHPEIDFGE